jgi:hypothetical protein
MTCARLLQHRALATPLSQRSSVCARGQQHRRGLAYCVTLLIHVLLVLAAWRSFDKGDIAKGRKIMGHTLRMLTLAPQLVRLHRIDDITAGNDAFSSAVGAPAETYAELRAAFTPAVLTLLADVEAASVSSTSDAPAAGAASRRRKK